MPVATVVADFRGKEITIKHYNGFYEFDKDMSKLDSIGDLDRAVGLHPEIGESLTIYDKDRKRIDIKRDPIIRTLLSFYENKKCDEFIRWIFNPLGNKGDLKKVGALKRYFAEKQQNFVQYTSEKVYCTEAFKKEAARLLNASTRIVNGLTALEDPNASMEYYSKEIHDAMEEYVHKDNAYNYAYMRKLARELAFRKYNFNGFKDIETTDQDQDSILYEYERLIRKKLNLGEEESGEDLEDGPSELLETAYDEKGEKVDEQPFLEEFEERKKANKTIKMIRG